MTTSHTKDEAVERDDLEKLYHLLQDGRFYEDYDESSRLAGVLRCHLAALRSTAPAPSKAREVEGDSDNPLRVAAANKLYDAAPAPAQGVVERLRVKDGCDNLHCGDSSRCFDCSGCYLHRALDELEKSLTREMALVEAMQSAIAHRYGEWEAILEDALTQHKDGGQ